MAEEDKKGGLDAADSRADPVKRSVEYLVGIGASAGGLEKKDWENNSFK